MKKIKTVPQYPGSSLNEVHALSDEKVLEELSRLNIEPCSYPYEDADDELFVHAYGTEDFEHVYSKAEIKSLRKKTDAWRKECLKGQLFSTYVAEWLATLSDSVLWLIVEEFEKEKVALSERRYTSRDKLRLRAASAVFASEQKKSV